MRISRIRQIIGLLVLNLTTAAQAQECPRGWTTGPLLPDVHGANGPIHAILAYDPPGSPPVQLIVGGEFTRIGNITANNIASWDGTIWRPLQDGADGPVHALIIFNNNLIVAGDFDSVGQSGPASRHIAAWNGAGWFSLSAGLGIATEFNGSIKLLAVFNGQLIAGGSVYTGSNGGYLFRLNGTTWQDISHPEAYEAPNFLEVFDRDGPGPFIPLIYCDCYDTIPVRLSRWNGSLWNDFLPAPTMFRHASTITNDGLVVAGNFMAIDLNGDDEWDESIHGIAAWNGNSWSGYGSGIVMDYQKGEKISAARQFGNDLVVAGKFANAGGAAAQNMARWNGSQWLSMGTLFSGSNYRGINEMRVHNNDLFVGGDFNLTDASGPINHLAKFTGAVWSTIKSKTTINALAAMGPYLVMGGDFGHVDGLAGTYDPYYIALWNGRTIQPVNGGVDGPVRALVGFTSFGGVFNNLIVGGDFTQVGSQGGIGGGDGGTAGAQTAYHIASWTDAPLGGWQPMGNGFNNSVLAIEMLSDGTIIAGGQFTFTVINPTNLNRIAKWSGSTASWTSMNTGFNNTVRAIKSYPASFPNSGSIIVAGGDFTIANGGAANRIAQWTGPLDNHASGWSAMGSGFNGPVHAIERHGNSTYAAGAFTASGATPLNNVARWNGTAWVAVGGGLNNVHALKSHNGFLYAACKDTVSSVLTASRWDGTSWTSLGGGLDEGDGYAIMPFKTELIYGGSFEKSQGGAIVSPGLALSHSGTAVDHSATDIANGFLPWHCLVRCRSAIGL